jgi:ABC-type branched-subunit amino acid transport system ATPase component
VIAIDVPPASSRLAIEGVRVQFGGLRALDDVSLNVAQGQIVSLIGPNGAGKTTLFNVVSGFIQPQAGRVTLDGTSLAAKGVVQRSRLGIARTFQRMELFDELTVLDNLLVTRELDAPFRGLRGMMRGPARPVQVVEDAEEALDELAILHLRDSLAGSLSTGQRRLVELGRILMVDASLLLLDEPSSGLDRLETRRFNETIRRLHSRRPQQSILLVEHDMTVALELADYVYVIDFGQMLTDGSPAAIRADERVHAAYLGREA